MRFINALVACSVIAITSTAGAQVARPLEWTTASGGNGHWYKLETVARNWLDQRNSAAAIGGHLATLNTPDESAWVTLQLPFSSACYLGAFQDTSSPAFSEPAGGWRWVTDEDPTTIAWCQDEPNNLVTSSGPQNVTQVRQATDCVDDTHGLVSFAAWVEWDADCNGDGIVDYGQCLNGTLPDYNGNNIPDCCERGEVCVTGNYPVQWRVADGGNGHWYQSRSTNGLTFTAARASARNIGGDLVTLQSALELDFVFRNLAADPSMWWHANGIPRHGPWIGLIQEHADPQYSEPAGGWTWSDGVSATFQSWEPTDPCATQPTDCFCGGSPCGLDNAGFYTGGASGSATAPTWGAFANDMSGRVGGVIIEWDADCNNDGIVDKGQILNGQLIDANSNGIPDSCEIDPCPGDISGNNAVDGVDLSVLLGVWGTDGSGGEFDADVTNDGIVNGADLTIILVGWGPCPN